MKFKAIFERFTEPDSKFGASVGTWDEVAREWVGLTPQRVDAQQAEFVDGNQNKAVSKSVADCCWSQTTAAVDVACRMKLAKQNIVDESEPNSDVNFRIFHIKSAVNVGEMNRELQFLVTEKV